MADFDGALAAAASAILKRELSDEEKREFRDIAGIIGMGSVEDYLYMLMVFKRNEDRITREIASFGAALSEKLGEISALEKKINGTLEVTIGRVLGEGAARIGADMGEKIAEGAGQTLASFGEYHFLRGQVWITFLMSVIASLSYWLGSANVIRGGGMGPLEILLLLPSGWLAVICCSMYAYMWSWDHWKLVKNSIRHKLIFASQILLIFCLMAFLLNG
jgi:hypothetical protein